MKQLRPKNRASSRRNPSKGYDPDSRTPHPEHRRCGLCDGTMTKISTKPDFDGLNVSQYVCECGHRNSMKDRPVMSRADYDRLEAKSERWFRNNLPRSNPSRRPSRTWSRTDLDEYSQTRGKLVSLKRLLEILRALGVKTVGEPGLETYGSRTIAYFQLAKPERRDVEDKLMSLGLKISPEWSAGGSMGNVSLAVGVTYQKARGWDE